MPIFFAGNVRFGVAVRLVFFREEVLRAAALAVFLALRPALVVVDRLADREVVAARRALPAVAAAAGCSSLPALRAFALMFRRVSGFLPTAFDTASAAEWATSLDVWTADEAAFVAVAAILDAVDAAVSVATRAAPAAARATDPMALPIVSAARVTVSRIPPVSSSR